MDFDDLCPLIGENDREVIWVYSTHATATNRKKLYVELRKTRNTITGIEAET